MSCAADSFDTRRRPLDLLMVGQKPLWPMDQGVTLRGLPMLTAWKQQGHEVAYAAMEPLADDACQAVRQMTLAWPTPSLDDVAELHRGWSGAAASLRRRLADHQGLSVESLAGIVTLVKRHRPKVVIGLGLHSPMMLKAISALPPAQRPKSVWYAADELIRYHLTCWPTDRLIHWPRRFHEMTLHGLIESLFVRGLDMAVGVTEQETLWLKRVAGARQGVTIPNGVELSPSQPSTHRAAGDSVDRPYTLDFWGRLDFTPNADAIDWFARRVWPTLKQRFPQAIWNIFGPPCPPAPPSSPLSSLPRSACFSSLEYAAATDPTDGIRRHGYVADLRSHLVGPGLAILPMRCGGGIKNKLLEAAAMSKPIIASPMAVSGLKYDELNPPFSLCRDPKQWIETIAGHWLDPLGAQRLGQRAHQWVERHHRWDAAAKNLWRPMMADPIAA